MRADSIALLLTINFSSSIASVASSSCSTSPSSRGSSSSSPVQLSLVLGVQLENRFASTSCLSTTTGLPTTLRLGSAWAPSSAVLEKKADNRAAALVASGGALPDACCASAVLSAERPLSVSSSSPPSSPSPDVVGVVEVDVGGGEAGEGSGPAAQRAPNSVLGRQLPWAGAEGVSAG